MSKCKYGMQKPVQNVLQQCINGFKRMEKGGIGVANECVQQACEMALKYINELEAKLADSKPVKHGHWIDWGGFGSLYNGFIPEYKCSVCNSILHSKRSYCGNCGAKMDGGEGE